MTSTRRASLQDLRKLHAAGETQPDRDNAATLGEMLPDGFWDDAEIIDRRPAKTSVHLRVDSDVLDFFKAQGKGHLTRMNAVLRSYVKAQKAK